MTEDPRTRLRLRFDLAPLRTLHARWAAGEADVEQELFDWVCTQGLAVPLISTIIDLADELQACPDAPSLATVRGLASGAVSQLNARYSLFEALLLAEAARSAGPQPDPRAAEQLRTLMKGGYLSMLIEAMGALQDHARALASIRFATDPSLFVWLSDRLPDLPDEPTAADHFDTTE